MSAKDENQNRETNPTENVTPSNSKRVKDSRSLIVGLIFAIFIVLVGGGLLALAIISSWK